MYYTSGETSAIQSALVFCAKYYGTVYPLGHNATPAEQMAALRFFLAYHENRRRLPRNEDEVQIKDFRPMSMALAKLRHVYPAYIGTYLVLTSLETIFGDQKEHHSPLNRLYYRYQQVWAGRPGSWRNRKHESVVAAMYMMNDGIPGVFYADNLHSLAAVMIQQSEESKAAVKRPGRIPPAPDIPALAAQDAKFKTTCPKCSMPRIEGKTCGVCGHIYRPMQDNGEEQ